MAQKLNIAEGLSFPLEAVTQTFAIIAKRGAGKTHTAVVLTEELLAAKQHVVIIDPLDVWFGLRSSKDGKKEGFAITVLGGEHGDLPLDAGSGQVIADFVVENRLSVILSIRHLSMSEQRRFVAEFATRLYERKGQDKFRQPLQLVLDEADEFAPQRIMPDQARMFGAIDRIVRRGRSAGLGVTLISQRAAVLNKDVLTQIEVLICLRTVSPQDRKALEAWIEAHDTGNRAKEFMTSLASLGIGEAWVWSPGWLDVFRRVQIRDRLTFDSSATPKVGTAVLAPDRIAPVNLDLLRKQLAGTIEQAKADDPKELRKQIAEWKAKAEQRVSAAPVIDQAAIDRAREDGMRQLREGIGLAIKALRDLAAQVTTAMDAAAERLEAQAQRVPPAPRVSSTTLPSKPVASTKVPVRVTQSAGASMEAGLRRILTALAQRSGLTDVQVGIRAQISAKSGTFGTYLGKARSNGWIEGTRKSLEITEAGVEALGQFEPLPEGRGLLQYWLGQVEAGASRMLQALVENGPMSAESLGQAAGISDKSGTFGTYLGKLRTLELVTGGRGELRASEELF